MITKLKRSQIFVFGSNLNGAHAGGAALTAYQKFGAVMGVGEGQTGQSYALPTLDKNMEKVSLAALKKSVNKFLKHAKEHPGYEFLLTKVGCGIAGFSEQEVRPLFSKIPENVVLPEDWVEKPGRVLYKFMHEGLKSDSGNHSWKIGQWYVERGIKICNKGFHASNSAREALGYVKGEVLAVVEARGVSIEEEDKSCWEEMRVVKAYKWQKKDSVAYSIFASELVLQNFEKVFPDDKRPREAIEAAKKWLADPTSANESAARSAESAESAARSAESAAWSAESAARSAESAESAAWSAESAGSAESAAWSAESAAWSAKKKLYAEIDTWFLERIPTLEEIV